MIFHFETKYLQINVRYSNHYFEMYSRLYAKGRLQRKGFYLVIPANCRIYFENDSLFMSIWKSPYKKIFFLEKYILFCFVVGRFRLQTSYCFRAKQQIESLLCSELGQECFFSDFLRKSIDSVEDGQRDEAAVLKFSYRPAFRLGSAVLGRRSTFGRRRCRGWRKGDRPPWRGRRRAGRRGSIPFAIPARIPLYLIRAHDIVQSTPERSLCMKLCDDISIDFEEKLVRTVLFYFLANEMFTIGNWVDHDSFGFHQCYDKKKQKSFASG